ncbi:uncharacterized protein VICG_00168 [Vittaforma corneae ATCC 50505]|uniref:SRP19 protein n=1 Tax=Vittaforma corneae (strain ATCC 50505) TaxID=993615 RepID=L2GPN4_VITCO|nr:uncharacterized protein VICG_00168 [Vittaforma corneae ATCC 50505]ELA42853.1 hypothetical protein VICG_00168 [Vittaforma corneae ATCC 50505]
MLDSTEKCFIIYPIYINSSVSLGRGRKYSLKNSVSKPTFKEIKHALDSLGVKYEEEPEKMHPKEGKEKGRFRIDKAHTRKYIVDNLAPKISELRAQADARTKSGSNLLNLVPKSRKKSKKAS